MLSEYGKRMFSEYHNPGAPFFFANGLFGALMADCGEAVSPEVF